MNEEQILCAASAYNQQFYFNPAFGNLPTEVQEELKILSVLFVEDVGGILLWKFEEDGSLLLETSADEGDLLYDDIGAALKIKALQRDQAELLASLELYYQIFK